MEEAKLWDVVIIGAGMAGLSTALWARRLGMSALVLEQSPQAGGQLTTIAGRIFDYPGLDLPDGQAFANKLLAQAEQAGVSLLLNRPVRAIDAIERSCETGAGSLRGRALVLATGLTAQRLQVPGEAELYQHGLIRRPSHDLLWFRNRRVVVVGGGDRAAENALMLAEVAEQVLLLHRGQRLRGRAEFLEPLLAHPRIDLHLRTQVRAFQVTPAGVRVEAVKTPRTGSPGSAGPKVAFDAEAVCIYIGNRPNTELVTGQVALDPDGYLITDRYGQSSLPGLFGVGDVCTLPPFQSLATASGQAMQVAKQISLQLA